MNMSFNMKNTIQNIQPLAAYENLLEAFLEVENQHNDNKSLLLTSVRNYTKYKNPIFLFFCFDFERFEKKREKAKIDFFLKGN